MKVAVIYNRESQKVINLFGVPNREKYGLSTIDRILHALKKAGHQAIALKGDKDLVDNLEKFMPRVLKGERPGIAFNLSYGIQGQARYTHVPSILEMVGIPYVGSGPLAHSIALDKVVAKMIFVQEGIPTPDYSVLQSPGFIMPEMEFPLIVKPKNEAVSFGIKIVNNADELREASQAIFDQFQQPVLVEEYIDGIEINVGVLGNSPAEAMLPAQISFGSEGPKIYTYEDKVKTSGRNVGTICPAQISDEMTANAQEIAIKAFNALGCYDCARIDMRIDSLGNIYVLEVNSLPSLSENASYVLAAQHMGLEFNDLVNRLVEVASARYFGTPTPRMIYDTLATPKDILFNYLTGERDNLEQCVQDWAMVSSRSNDSVGILTAVDLLTKTIEGIGLKPVREFTNKRHTFCWETRAGMQDGILLIGHIDVPINPYLAFEAFRSDPEFLYGEGIGSSRASLAMLEYSLKALKQVDKLDQLHLGVLYYGDEGLDCVESEDTIRKACMLAKKILILRPGNAPDKVITSRRGQSRYRLTVEGEPKRLGAKGRKPDLLRVLYCKLDQLSKLSLRKERIAVSAVDIKTEAHPGMIPHRAVVEIQTTYPTKEKGTQLEKSLKEILSGDDLKWRLAKQSDRPPMTERKTNQQLLNSLNNIATEWDIPLSKESSLMPSVAGLVPRSVPTICGIGPVVHNLYTSRESIERISLVQRTLLLSQLLLEQSK